MSALSNPQRVSYEDVKDTWSKYEVISSNDRQYKTNVCRIVKEWHEYVDVEKLKFKQTDFVSSYLQISKYIVLSITSKNNKYTVFTLNHNNEICITALVLKESCLNLDYILINPYIVLNRGIHNKMTKRMVYVICDYFRFCAYKYLNVTAINKHVANYYKLSCGFQYEDYESEQEDSIVFMKLKLSNIS